MLEKVAQCRFMIVNRSVCESNEGLLIAGFSLHAQAL